MSGSFLLSAFALPCIFVPDFLGGLPWVSLNIKSKTQKIHILNNLFFVFKIGKPY